MDDKRLDRIEDKLDSMVDHMSAMDATLAAQHVSLTDHIRRTEILEEETKAVKKHVDTINGSLKLLGVIAVVFEIYKAMK